MALVCHPDHMPNIYVQLELGSFNIVPQGLVAPIAEISHFINMEIQIPLKFSMSSSSYFP